jgi:hypothetical protein
MNNKNKITLYFLIYFFQTHASAPLKNQMWEIEYNLIKKSVLYKEK